MGRLVLSKFNHPVHLIVGLGNVGMKYELSRHNAGFLFLDALNSIIGEEYTSYISTEREFELHHYKTLELTLLKPKLMMNLSGEALKSYLKYHDILDCKDILVVHDDLDIPFGSFKLQLYKSPRLHNGIKSIENSLKTQEFYRLRVGVDNRTNRNLSPVDFVLKKMTVEEIEELKGLFMNTIKEEFTYLD